MHELTIKLVDEFKRFGGFNDIFADSIIRTYLEEKAKEIYETRQFMDISVPREILGLEVELPEKLNRASTCESPEYTAIADKFNQLIDFLQAERKKE